MPNRKQQLQSGEPSLALPSVQEEIGRVYNGQSPSAAVIRAARDAGYGNNVGQWLLREADNFPTYKIAPEVRKRLLRSSRDAQGVIGAAQAMAAPPRPIESAMGWFFNALTGTTAATAAPMFTPTIAMRQGGGRNGGGPFMDSKGSLPVSSLGGLARSAGFSTEQAVIMAAIAMAESSGRAKAHNDNRSTGDDSYGLWQINMIDRLGPERRRQFGISSNAALFDPTTNAKAARLVYLSQGFGAWSVYRNGAYRQYLPAARRAISGR